MSGRISKFHNDFCKCQAAAQSFCSCREGGIPSRAQGCGPGRSPETPPLTRAASESPEVPCADTQNSSAKTRLLGGSEDPARARETVNSRTSLSLEQSLFQQAELLPFEHCSSLPPHLPLVETSLRTVKQLPFIFIYLCTITYQFMM